MNQPNSINIKEIKTDWELWMGENKDIQQIKAKWDPDKI